MNMKRETKPISPRNRKSNTLGSIRIIAGMHRGRKLPVLEVDGLRPTTDRTKETVFNWLMHDIQNSSCLDLFAGSGGLGLEALSRYAKKVTFVEKDKAVSKQILNNLNTLRVNANNYALVEGDALAFVGSVNETFDLIFLDPPFGKDLLNSSVATIFQRKLLSQDGLVYIEHENSLHFDGSQYGLTLVKQKQTSQVNYSLWSNGCSN